MCVSPFLHISLALSPPLDSPASKMNTNRPTKDREEVEREEGGEWGGQAVNGLNDRQGMGSPFPSLCSYRTHRRR